MWNKIILWNTIVRPYSRVSSKREFKISCSPNWIDTTVFFYFFKFFLRKAMVIRCADASNKSRRDILEKIEKQT